ncbi:hypothetical protein LTR16_007946, partial [Cryomyces antarcticus]
PTTKRGSPRLKMKTLLASAQGSPLEISTTTARSPFADKAKNLSVLNLQGRGSGAGVGALRGLGNHTLLRSPTFALNSTPQTVRLAQDLQAQPWVEHIPSTTKAL